MFAISFNLNARVWGGGITKTFIVWSSFFKFLEQFICVFLKFLELLDEVYYFFLKFYVLGSIYVFLSQEHFYRTGEFACVYERYIVLSFNSVWVFDIWTCRFLLIIISYYYLRQT